MRRRFMNKSNIVIDNYLTIEALEDGLTASLSSNACEYCIDGDGKWKHLKYGTETSSIDAGHTISFKGEITPGQGMNNLGIGTFTISKKCNLKGNCMSMLFGDNAANNFSLRGKDYAFYELFSNCAIVNVSSNFLPATILSDFCYEHMFRDCTLLVNAPELPATTLAKNCYYEMFHYCISLVNAPELPATTLTDYCYYYMFCFCRKLNYIKMLATDISANSCLEKWVSVVSSTGTFVKNKDATWDVVGINGVPEGWTVITDYMLEYIGGKENLITFMVETRRLAAKKDMTWKEWCNTPMNSSNNIYINGGVVYTGTDILINNGVVVREDDVIINGAEYDLQMSEPA